MAYRIFPKNIGLSASVSISTGFLKTHIISSFRTCLEWIGYPFFRKGNGGGESYGGRGFSSRADIYCSLPFKREREKKRKRGGEDVFHVASPLHAWHCVPREARRGPTLPLLCLCGSVSWSLLQFAGSQLASR